MKKGYLLLLILGAVLIVAFSIILYLNLQQVVIAAHLRKVLFIQNHNLANLLLSIQDAETGQRGFIITGSEEYLLPYHQALTSIQNQLRIIEEDIDSDLNQQQLYQALQFPLKNKLEELSETIQVRKNLGFEAAQRMISSNQGKKWMDEIRALIQEMQNHKQELLQNADEDLYLLIHRFKELAVLAIFFSIGLTSLYIYFLYRDNQLRKKAEEELKKSYNIQKVILDNAKQYIITTDNKGNILTFNRGGEKMLGYHADEVVNKVSVLNLYAQEMLEKLVKDISRRKGENIKPSFEALITPNRYSILTDSEWLLKSKNGKLIPCLQSITALRDQDDAVTGFLFIGTDVTDRKLWEEDLKRAVEAADAANLAKSKFLANISHDLRTPLNSIIGFSNLLMKNKNGNLKEQELSYIKRIVDNGKFLLNLINEILDLSKIEVGMVETKKVPVNLSDLIRKVLDQLEGKVIEKGKIKLLQDIPKDLKPLETDPEKLEIILNNLIGNAIKYTKVGQVMVKVNKDPDTHEATEIEVIDTGIGIQSSYLDKIFEPFFQVDGGLSRQYGGTGLGLSITHSMCQLLGYEIQVKSEVNKGSTFTIALIPQSSHLANRKLFSKSLLSKNYEEGNHPSDVYNQTILIIDNDVNFVALLGHEFQNLGCNVIPAINGEEALDLAKKNHIDLITLGVLLYPMNGYEIVKRFQEDEDLKKIPFAFISLVANEMRGKVPGALDYLDKHVTHGDLINLLKKASLYWKNPS